MGVLKFQSFLRREFKEHCSRQLATLTDEREVRRLFVDFNAMIHNAINDTYSTEDPDELRLMFESPESYWLSPEGVVDHVMQEMIEVLDIARPKELLYIAADGPVMRAKLAQQRQRTYKSKPGSQPFDRNLVKPGTEFMITICSEVRSRLGKLAMEITAARGNFPHEVIFSDAFAPGEGEHKIMTMLKTKAKKNNTYDRQYDVVYSPDSDMHFLVYLHAAPNDNVVIMRRTHKIGEDGEKYEYFHATRIRAEIIKMGFPNIRDFVLICCFGGNDFVPALAFAKFGDGDVFGTLMRTYIATFGRQKGLSAIFSGTSIKWNMLLRYVQALLPASDTFLSKAGTMQVEQSHKFYDPLKGEDRRSKVLMWAMGYEGNESGKPDFDASFFNSRYKQFIFGTFHQIDQPREEFNFDATQEQVHNYLEGLVWVLSYYDNQEEGVNHDWVYSFHYPPDVVDLADYLQLHQENPTWEVRPLDTSIQPINSPMEHLMAILRKEQLYMLPTVLKTIVIDQLPHLYPEEVQVDLTNVPFGDEGREIVLIDFPDMTEIRNVFSAVRDDPNVKSRNLKKGNLRVWPRVKASRTKKEGIEQQN